MLLVHTQLKGNDSSGLNFMCETMMNSLTDWIEMKKVPISEVVYVNNKVTREVFHKWSGKFFFQMKVGLFDTVCY